jgi:HTH-type transcriptional regulator, competence development regulator
LVTGRWGKSRTRVQAHGSEAKGVALPKTLDQEVFEHAKERARRSRIAEGVDASSRANTVDVECSLQALRLIRAIRDLPLKTAAVRAGVSPAYLQKLERGEIKSPSPHRLYRLARVYDFPYPKLMELAGYIYPDDLDGESSTMSNTDRLAKTIVAAGLEPGETEWLARSLCEYRHAREAGIEIPPEFLSAALKTYREMHQRSSARVAADLVAAVTVNSK